MIQVVPNNDNAHHESAKEDYLEAKVLHKRFAHPKVAKLLPGMEGMHSLKGSVAISDEHKASSPRLQKRKPNLTIRKESFESEDSTNESILSEDLSNLSPKSRMMRELVSDYGCSIDNYLRKQEKENSIS